MSENVSLTSEVGDISYLEITFDLLYCHSHNIQANRESKSLPITPVLQFESCVRNWMPLMRLSITLSNLSTRIPHSVLK